MENKSGINLSFGILLAPYRVDYYNYLHDNLNFEIFFCKRTFPGQMYNTEDLEKSSTYVPQYLSKRKILGRFFLVKGLRSIIKDHNPKCIIVPEFSILTLQIILIKFIFGYKFKILSQCDDSYDMLNGGKSFSKIHSVARKFFMPFISDLILVDPKSKDWYQKNYHKGRWMPIIQDESKKSFYTYNLKEMSNCIRQEYKLDGVLSIIFVARHIELKNLPILLKSCCKLTQPYKLIVVGDGIMRQKWEKLSIELNVNAVFVGQKNGLELEAFYHACDIFVLPSYLEPFGAVTNEALLCGCISLVSQNAGSSCLIENGKNGYVFNPESVDDLRSKIESASTLIISPKHNVMNFNFEDLMKKSFEGLC